MSGDARRIEHLLPASPGGGSGAIAVKLAELADVHRQLRETIHPLEAATLSWQPAPGFNTIGMLLTHLALAEVNYGQVILRGGPPGRVSEVLGIGVDDDGMPLPEDGLPPAAIAGKPVAFFVELLDRALAHTRDSVVHLDEDALDTELVRPPQPDGRFHVYSQRWVLHHLVEHVALHLGHIQVLAHLARRRTH